MWLSRWVACVVVCVCTRLHTKSETEQKRVDVSLFGQRPKRGVIRPSMLRGGRGGGESSKWVWQSEVARGR